MQEQLETIELQVRDYISPECSRKIEDMVASIPHEIESSFDPVNNLLKVKVHKGMVSAGRIIEELKRCAVRCEQRKPSHEMAHILVPYGIMLRPEFGAITMSASSISVVVNALLLKREKI